MGSQDYQPIDGMIAAGLDAASDEVVAMRNARMILSASERAGFADNYPAPERACWRSEAGLFSGNSQSRFGNWKIKS
jgi:hypothetical protein